MIAGRRPILRLTLHTWAYLCGFFHILWYNLARMVRERILDLYISSQHILAHRSSHWPDVAAYCCSHRSSSNTIAAHHANYVML